MKKEPNLVTASTIEMLIAKRVQEANKEKFCLDQRRNIPEDYFPLHKRAANIFRMIRETGKRRGLD